MKAGTYMGLTSVFSRIEHSAWNRKKEQFKKINGKEDNKKANVNDGIKRQQ